MFRLYVTEEMLRFLEFVFVLPLFVVLFNMSNHLLIKICASTFVNFKNKTMTCVLHTFVIFVLYVLCEFTVAIYGKNITYATNEMSGSRESILSNKNILSVDQKKVDYIEHFVVNESKYGKLVKGIKVEGNDRIPLSSIIAHSSLKIGKKYQDDAFNNSMKAIYATGFFKDLKIDYDKKTQIVTIKLVENPTVNQIAFKGNSQLNTKELNSVIQIKSSTPYSLNTINDDIKLIIGLYQHMGFFAVTVRPKIIERSNNRVDVLYVINENRKAKIGKILFSGNEKILDADLRKVITTTERAWFHILSSRGLYERSQILMDKDALDQFYHAMGYADFKVLDIVSELSPQKDAFVITFILDEGKKYSIGSVDLTISQGIYGLDATQIKKFLRTKSQSTYNKNIIDNDIQILKHYLGTKGYAFASIDFNEKRDKKHSIANIAFTIQEGAKLYINKIDIKDNVRTLDKVIRREMKLSEGDSFNTDLLETSKYSIERLNYFSEVKIEQKETNVPDKIDLDVFVKEKPTGTLNLAGGYSDSDGIMGTFSISENNLLGTGRTALFNLKKDRYKTGIDLGFSQPYFDDRNMVVGGDLFFRREILGSRQRDENAKNDSSKVVSKSFKDNIIGATLYMMYPLAHRLEHQIRYSPKYEDVTLYQTSHSPLLQSAAGKYFISTIGQTFFYDKRNNPFSPSSGYFIRFAQDIDGIGGKVKNFKNVLDFAYYYPLYKDFVVLQLNGGAGSIMGYRGDIVRLNHNFYLGEDEIRGFDRHGIGPRDRTTGDAVGGKYYYKLSTEVNFPLGLPKEFGIKGAVFFDAASSFNIDLTNDLKEKNLTPKCTSTNINNCLYFDDNKLRSSYGLGVLWDSPLGTVIRVDYGWVVSKASFDSTKRIRLVFTQQF